MTASFNCNECQDKTCIKTKKVCEKIEKILRAEGVKDSEWIRPRVNSSTAKKDGFGQWREKTGGYGSREIEGIANMRAFQLRYGKNYNKQKGQEV